MVGVIAAAACSSRDGSQTPVASGSASAGHSGQTGNVGAQLTIPGGEHFSVISYTLTNIANTYSGTEAISTASTASFVVANVTAGNGYTFTFNARSDDGIVACTATAGPFAVANRVTTIVNASLTCTAYTDGGILLINAVSSNCPIWNTLIAYPNVASTTAPGNTMQLVAGATAPNPGLLTFTWSASAGTLSSTTGTLDPNSNDAGIANDTTFTCPSTPGPVTISLVVADGPLPVGGGCPTNYTNGSITVNCQMAACTFGTGCGDGGQICNAAGSCVPALFSVVTLNGDPDGSTIDNSNKQLPISIQNYGLSGPQGAPIALPTGTDSRPAISLQGNNITEGDLTTSSDGRYLSLLGWNAAPLTSIQTAPVVVARIDSSGNVDTSTVSPTAFHDGQMATALRSCASLDGSGFWCSGENASPFVDGGTISSGGIYYLPFGSASSTQLVPFPNSNTSIDPNFMVSARWLRLFGGQLYASTDLGASQAAPGQPPYMINIGGPGAAPTSGSPVVNLLSGGFETWSGPTPSPYGFVMFDISAPSGPDTMYIADDGLNPLGTAENGGTDTNTGGIYKWTFDGTNWNQVTTWKITGGTFADAGASINGKNIGFRGIAGFATGTLVTLMATTGNINGNPDSLVLVLQEQARATTAPMPMMFPSTPPSQVLRGVALTPQ
jgi:hypothetical protein